MILENAVTKLMLIKTQELIKRNSIQNQVQIDRYDSFIHQAFPEEMMDDGRTQILPWFMKN